MMEAPSLLESPGSVGAWSAGIKSIGTFNSEKTLWQKENGIF